MNFKEWLLTESKSGIVSLGIPEVVAVIFNSKFGKLAPLIAKWFRDHKWHRDDFPKNWWQQAYSSLATNQTLADYTNLYKAAGDKKSYNDMLQSMGYSADEYEDFDSDEIRKALRADIEKMLMSDYFFKREFIKKILSGDIRDLSPYKDLRFYDAQEKYEKKRIFATENPPLRSYPDGYKWINVGPQCSYIGGLMKNCGSSGLMSMDPDRTMLVLFDSENKPHIVVTYSPNDRHISGDEGVASSVPKEKYHDYILDIANFLGAEYDAMKSKSSDLRIKYYLQKMGANFKKIPIEDSWYTYYSFDHQGKKYFTNGYIAIPADDVDKVADAVANKKLDLGQDMTNIFTSKTKDSTTQNKIIEKVFNPNKQKEFEFFGVRFKPLSLMAMEAI